MEATVGDTEFWLLAKRVVASGGTVASNDSVFSLQAKLTDLAGSGGGGGGGGGIPEAPTDGKLYGRENTAWAVVPSGGGAFDSKTVRFFDDFESDANGQQSVGPWKLSTAVAVSVPPSSVHENGVWQSNAGIFFTPSPAREPILLGTNTVSCRWRAMIPVLPAGHILFCFGLFSGVPGNDNLSGDVAFGFESTLSPNWRVRSTNADTGVAVVAGQWYDLVIVTDPVNSTYSIGSNNAAPVQVAQIPTASYGNFPVGPYAGGYWYSGAEVFAVDCYEQKIAWTQNRMLL
jgi:hypothetical protein